MDIDSALQVAQIILLVVSLVVIIYLHRRYRGPDALKELRIDFVYLFFGFLFGVNLGIDGFMVMEQSRDPFYGPGMAVGVVVAACMLIVVWSIGRTTVDKIAAYKYEQVERRRIQEVMRVRQEQNDTEPTSAGDLLDALIGGGTE